MLPFFKVVYSYIAIKRERENEVCSATASPSVHQCMNIFSHALGESRKLEILPLWDPLLFSLFCFFVGTHYL